MTNFEVVVAITENMEAVLKSIGIHFARKTFDDERNIPAALVPFGEIFYEGESFEDGFNEKPGYGLAEFALKVVIGALQPDDAMIEQQRFAHLLRNALSVTGLNVGALAPAKPVSRVRIMRVEAHNTRSVSSVSLKAAIRYREA